MQCQSRTVGLDGGPSQGDARELKTGLWHAGPCYASPVSHAPSLPNQGPPRHTLLVRVTHWITVISFIALLVSGVEILISHPRFYWGEVGNSRTPPLFDSDPFFASNSPDWLRICAA